MEVFKTTSDLRQYVENQRRCGKNIGLVPTMGALHKGHISLVDKAGSMCDCVVVSIFVNPTQFNNPLDLQRYPRTLDKDLALLSTTKCSAVFAPSAEEVYPEPDTRKFDFGCIEKVMEGAHRPGHFNGVAQIVSKLFYMVEPDRAFFGMKDFQQIAIIKDMVRQLSLKVEIVECPIIREPDGLAMSSRNTLLSPEQRKNAVHISKTLMAAASMSKKKTVEEVKKWVIAEIDSNPYLETEYFDIVDDKLLQSVTDWNGNRVGCVAVNCGEIRLIDNIKF